MKFRRYAALADDELELLPGAVILAQDEYPALDERAVLQRLDEIVEPVADLGSEAPAAQVLALKEHLFGRLGFAGNVADYRDPRNSFINDVLERKKGIPITLAIVYIEVARRLGLAASGVCFPAHFLVRIDWQGERAIVDPFSGDPLDGADLERLLNRSIGRHVSLESRMLSPAPTRHIIARMLMNLRGIYAERADHPRLLVVLDHLIDLLPEVSNEMRDRGLLWAKLGAPHAALSDLNRYVELLPHASDADEIRRMIDELESRASVVN